MRIVVLGAPGAGKGTQCKRIVDRYGLAHLSSGDILRQHRTKGTTLGSRAQQYMDSGALVPDDLVVEMMAEAIKNAPGTGFVLDGFPRTVDQAARLDELLSRDGQTIDSVLNLVVDDKHVLERLTGRRSCPVCGAVYHVSNLKPKVDGRCDRDGAELVQRPDDTAEVVSTRLQTYHLQTEPVVDYYNRAGKVIEIDANQQPEQVSAAIFTKLDALVDKT